jgi:hypothetical protein
MCTETRRANPTGATGAASASKRGGKITCSGRRYPEYREIGASSYQCAYLRLKGGRRDEELGCHCYRR